MACQTNALFPSVPKYYPFCSCKIRVIFPEGSLENVPPESKLMAILDEDWPAFLEEKRCMVRDRLNRWIVTLEAGQTRGREASFETVITQASSRVKLMLLLLDFGSAVAFKLMYVPACSSFV